MKEPRRGRTEEQAVLPTFSKKKVGRRKGEKVIQQQYKVRICPRTAVGKRTWPHYKLRIKPPNPGATVVSTQIKSSVSATTPPQRLNCAFVTVYVALPKALNKAGFAL
jgi:hypothetical protein